MERQDGYKGPDFLCIGAPKCGSTWLYELLGAHPTIFFPEEVKEIRYFTRYHERGDDWYRKLYNKQQKNQTSGDITPHYLYVESVDHIARFNPDFKFILIYRDPVQRCVSHYKFRIRSDNYKKSFGDFMKDYPDSVEWGFYAKHLSKFTNVFPENQFLFLSFENATENVEETKTELARFLGVDYSLFPADAGYSRVNIHKEPRFPRVYKLGVKVSRLLVDLKLYRLRVTIRDLGKGLLAGRSSSSAGAVDHSVSQIELEKLGQLYQEDQETLRRIIRSNCQAL